MLYFLVRRSRRDSVTRDTLRYPGRAPFAHIERLIRTVPYGAAANADRLPAGTYVFTDVEYLDPATRAKALRIWSALTRARLPVLNSPAYALDRFALLRRLYERGINRFNVYRPDEAMQVRRFPVFLCNGSDRPEPCRLLHGRDELLAAIDMEERLGLHRPQRMICEHLDTADADGLFRKYAAFVLDNAVIPRHLLCSGHWGVRTTNLDHADQVAAWLEEERAYLRDNPHADALREVCALARIRYGRVDYALVDGRIQVWGITTNPPLLSAEMELGPGRQWVQERFFGRFAEAASDLDAALRPNARAAPLRRGLGLRSPLRSAIARLFGRSPAVLGDRSAHRI